MARSRRKRLVGIAVLIIIIILTGGYFAKRSLNQGMAAKRSSGEGGAATADSVADSSVAAGDSAAAGEEDDKDKDDKDKKKEPDPVPVEIALVNPRQISSYYYTTATLEPERKVNILAKIAGEVQNIRVEEGDVVKAGALLCQLEGSEWKVALDEARINKEQQEREFSRIESMYREKLISDKEYADAKYQYELADNKYKAAAVRYEYTKIRAPFGGVVTKRHVEIGQNLNVGSQVFELADLEPLLIRMYLPENEVNDIHIGQKVSIHPDSDAEKALWGQVVRIAPEVDERTGTVKVTAETRGDAIPGSFVRVKIITDTRDGTLTIPRRGLISDAGELYVFVAEADTARKVPIQVGYQDENHAEVLGGVERGDSVVVIGTGGLRTGTKIKVVEATMQEELSQQDEAAESEPASN